MIYGIYPLLSGSMAQETALEVINNNLANINTTGYKKDHVTFKEYMAKAENTPELTRKYADYAVFNDIGTDFSNGAIKHTGNALDLALEGKGFFTIQTNNETAYTRNGTFTINSNNELVTQEGYRVLGNTGPITLPDGEITISQDGIVTVGGAEIDKLKIVVLDHVQKLGSSLFKRSPNTVERQDEDTRILQGALEMSNVNPISELTEMIKTVRSYETLLKLISGMDELSGRGINDLGRT